MRRPSSCCPACAASARCSPRRSRTRVPVGHVALRHRARPHRGQQTNSARIASGTNACAAEAQLGDRVEAGDLQRLLNGVADVVQRQTAYQACGRVWRWCSSKGRPCVCDDGRCSLPPRRPLRESRLLIRRSTRIPFEPITFPVADEMLGAMSPRLGCGSLEEAIKIALFRVRRETAHPHSSWWRRGHIRAHASCQIE